jgi:hypothetical protein
VKVNPLTKAAIGLTATGFPFGSLVWFPGAGGSFGFADLENRSATHTFRIERVSRWVETRETLRCGVR